MENEKLSQSEWIVVVSLLMLLLTITLISHKHLFSMHANPLGEPFDVTASKISVQVEGAVEVPGIYLLEPGAKIEDALTHAKPASNADLKGLNLTKKMKDGQTLRVPALQFIKILIKGAVKYPGEMIVPKGTRFVDLLNLIEFEPGADLHKLKGKKRLREGEVVQVYYEKTKDSPPGK